MQDQDDKKEIKKLKKKLKVQEKKNSEIRDQMAMERTSFANERTLMAYMRTAVAVIGAGILAAKFADDLYLQVAGLALLPIGLFLGAFGFYRYHQKQKLISNHTQHYSPTSHHHSKIHKKEAGGYGNID
jgi:putative membrane protein